MKALFPPFALLGLTAFLNVWSQTPSETAPVQKPPLPSGDLIRKLDQAEWVVTWNTKAASPQPGAVQNSSASKAPTPPPDQVITVKKDKNLRYIECLAGSQKSAAWCVGRMELILYNNIWYPMGNTNTSIPDYTTSDFPECSWISRANYVGIGTQKSRKCYLFQDILTTESPERLAEIKEDAKNSGQPFNMENYRKSVSAYIDFETSLPVYVEQTNYNLTYTFIPGSTTLPPVPAQVLQSIRVIQNR